MDRLARSRFRRARGFGLVEVLVGISIGLLALLIIYQALALSEGYRRTTTAGGDAQSSGMISTYLLGQDIANAGNTLADTAGDLINCDPAANFAANLRPIPVLITDGGADNASDTIAVYYGVNRRLVTAVDTRLTAAPGDPFVTQSPLGWAVGHMFVIMNPVAVANPCETATVTALAGPNAQGEVTITHSGVVNSYPQPSWIVNLGPANNVRKVQFDVAGEVLRQTNLLDVVPTPNPIASNVVLMKAQYGLDNSVPPDGAIDTWVNARDAPWRPVDVLSANLAQLRRIKAVRIALVVRSGQFERAKDAEGRDTDTGGPLAAINSGLVIPALFPCNGLPGCTGEMTSVAVPNTQGFRYRVFEQVIPLRNMIWNP
jgi:type IV pilus assembly protein PilW